MTPTGWLFFFACFLFLGLTLNLHPVFYLILFLVLAAYHASNEFRFSFFWLVLALFAILLFYSSL